MTTIDPWYLKNLVCPVDKSSLAYIDGNFVSSAGREYPVVDGVPVMLVDDVEQTMSLVHASLERARNNDDILDKRAENFYLESLGISEEEKEGIVKLADNPDLKIDPVVSFMIGATSGYAYKDLIGKVNEYPIPELRLPDSNGELLLDIGCNWGRWSTAASRKGYEVVGLDPSLGAIMAAKRVADQLGLSIRFVVGDARYLPFRNELFNYVFSYSVLQHFSKINVTKALNEVSRVLDADGESLIQMPNFLGIRSLQHQLKRKFREAEDFEVRYWSVPELKNTFNQLIGISELSVDCYFGLGLQKSDMKYMSTLMKITISISEVLRKVSTLLSPIIYVADSVYIWSKKMN